MNLTKYVENYRKNGFEISLELLHKEQKKTTDTIYILSVLNLCEKIDEAIKMKIFSINSSITIYPYFDYESQRENVKFDTFNISLFNGKEYSKEYSLICHLFSNLELPSEPLIDFINIKDKHIFPLNVPIGEQLKKLLLTPEMLISLKHASLELDIPENNQKSKKPKL